MIATVRYTEPVVVVGDVHGRADLLERLLQTTEPRPVLVIGDVCDRGSDTRRCIDLLIARGAIGVRGNHDEWLLAWAHGEGFDSSTLSPHFGGAATLRSYGVDGRTPREVEAQRRKVPRAHLQWLEALSVAIDLEVQGKGYWLVHAGIPPGIAPATLASANVVPWFAEQRSRTLRWSSTHPNDVPALDRPLIMGHVPLPEPLDTGAVIAIDTGAGTFDEGRLTAVLLPERAFVSVGPTEKSPDTESED